MTMYINPFVAGILVTIFVELALILMVAIFCSRKR